MNDIIWKQIGECLGLYAADDDLIASIEKEDLKVWHLYSYIQYDTVEKLIYANSIEEAKWKATNELYNQCNKCANYYHRIRDHLPNIHNLYDLWKNKTDKRKV